MDDLVCQLVRRLVVESGLGADAVDDAEALAEGGLQYFRVAATHASSTDADLPHEALIDREGGFDLCHLSILPYRHTRRPLYVPRRERGVNRVRNSIEEASTDQAADLGETSNVRTGARS